MIRWKLNEVMAKRRIRNKDLAEALDITENSVYRLRKTDEMPRLTPERLNGICAVLRCQPGDLLEWVPDGEEVFDWVLDREELPEPVMPPAEVQAVPKRVLDSLTRYCDSILALAWKGYLLHGAGAVVYTEKPDGPEIAYIERGWLADPDCRQVIDENRPELSAVVLYYYGGNYDSNEYSIFNLTGPKSPPECYAALTEKKK